MLRSPYRGPSHWRTVASTLVRHLCASCALVFLTTSATSFPQTFDGYGVRLRIRYGYGLPGYGDTVRYGGLCNRPRTVSILVPCLELQKGKAASRGGLSEIAQLLYLRGKSTLPFSAPAKQTERPETCGEEWKCGWEWNLIYAHIIQKHKTGVVAKVKAQNRVR